MTLYLALVSGQSRKQRDKLHTTPDGEQFENGIGECAHPVPIVNHGPEKHPAFISASPCELRPDSCKMQPADESHATTAGERSSLVE